MVKKKKFLLKLFKSGSQSWKTINRWDDGIIVNIFWINDISQLKCSEMLGIEHHINNLIIIVPSSEPLMNFILL